MLGWEGSSPLDFLRRGPFPACITVLTHPTPWGCEVCLLPNTQPDDPLDNATMGDLVRNCRRCGHLRGAPASRLEPFPSQCMCALLGGAGRGAVLHGAWAVSHVVWSQLLDEVLAWGVYPW